MKKIILSIFVASAFNMYAQNINYNDLGVLFSKDNNLGTARFEGMSGAFGALGGDISSINVNPAGMSVANGSLFSATLGVQNLSTDTKYYDNNTKKQDDFFSMPQIGGTLVFNSRGSSDWTNRTMTLNYNKKTHFESVVKGETKNGKFLKFDKHLEDAKPAKYVFDHSLEQEFNSKSSGSSRVFNLGFSGCYKGKLYLGGTLNFHSFQYTQNTFLGEVNEDANSNKLVSSNEITSNIDATGISLGLGVIYKINHNLRLGFAYETPAWYGEIIDDYQDYLAMEAVGTNLKKADDTKNNTSSYNFKTPSRLTFSGAYVFGKQGLISIDYTYKNHKNMKYDETDEIFVEANDSFMENYRNTHAVNIGTEWRFNALSVRGGYHYQQTPNVLVKSKNLNGFSLGAGYVFGNTRFDLSYRYDNSGTSYKVYNLNDTSVDKNTSRILGTLTFNL